MTSYVAEINLSNYKFESTNYKCKKIHVKYL